MNLSNIQNLLLISAAFILIASLLLYAFIPKLRKNTLRFIGIKEYLNIPPLEEQYAKEIAAGDVLLIKATKESTRKHNLGVIKLFLVFIATIYIILFKFSSLLYGCYFSSESFSLSLFMRNDLVILFSLFYVIGFLIAWRNIKRGKATGWDGDTGRAVYEDEIIEKFTEKSLKKHRGEMRFNIAMLILIAVLSLNWSAIKKAVSFSDANKIAHQQCLDKKAEREQKKESTKN